MTQKGPVGVFFIGNRSDFTFLILPAIISEIDSKITYEFGFEFYLEGRCGGCREWLIAIVFYDLKLVLTFIKKNNNCTCNRMVT